MLVMCVVIRFPRVGEICCTFPSATDSPVKQVMGRKFRDPFFFPFVSLSNPFGGSYLRFLGPLGFRTTSPVNISTTDSRSVCELSKKNTEDSSPMSYHSLTSNSIVQKSSDFDNDLLNRKLLQSNNSTNVNSDPNCTILTLFAINHLYKFISD